MRHNTAYRLLAAALLATIVATGAAAQDAPDQITFSQGQAATTYGTGGKNAETYDVALRLYDEALVGAQVKAVRIAFPSAEHLSGAKAWLATQLPDIKSSKAQDPDITQKAFDVSTEWVEVTFDTPYTLTQDGVYVGYSFDVEKVDKAVQPVLTTGYTSPDGFYIHTTKVYRTAWRPLYGSAGDLAIEVVLAGDVIMRHAAAVSYIPELNTRSGLSTDVTFEVRNLGNEGIKSLDYTYQLDGQTHTAHADVDVAPVFGYDTELTLTLPAIASKGVYPLDISIASVNGQPNEYGASGLTANVNVYNTLPKHRPLLEEYTGTWCGYCPRGFVGLEEMNRLFPDDFIGVSYHNGDAMEVTSQFPSSISGFPDAWLDRTLQVDAFCGFSAYGVFGIDKVWKLQSETFAPAAIDIATEWSGEETLQTTAYVTFPLDRDDCPYEVGFLLVEDGLTGTGSGWTQSNYYNGETGWPESMDLFTQGGSKVSGLVFNDVLVARSSLRGIEGSLQAPIVADVAQQYTYTFNMADVKNTSGESLVHDKQQLRVVAILIDKESGVVVNAQKAVAGTGTTGVGTVAMQPSEVPASTVYHDMQGRRVTRPGRGIYIKTVTLADGTTHSVKQRF